MAHQSRSFQLSPQGALQDNLVLGIIMLFFYLGTLALSPLNVPDEGRYPSIALSMLQHHDYVSTMLNGVVFMDKPALYYWLEAFSMHLFGLHEWSIRLPMALTGVFGIVLTQRITAIFYGRRASWLAGISLGTSVLYYISSHYADMDLEVAVWLAASMFFILLGLQYPLGKIRRFLFYTAYVFAAAAMLTKGLMGIVFPAMVLGLYSLLTRQWFLIKTIYLPSGLLIFFILCAPWYILMHKAHPNFFNYFFIYQQFTRFTESGFNSGAPFWIYLPIIFFGFFPWSFFISKAIKQALHRPWQHSPAFYLAIWAISIFIFFSIPSSKPVTYIMPVFPPLAVLIGQQLDHWLKKQTPCFATYFICCLTAVLGIVSLLAGLSVKIKVPENAHTGFMTLGIILLVSTLITCLLALYKNRKGLIVIAAVSLAALLATAASVSGYFNKMSTHSLALSIKDKITPETRIINYRQYFYDLPLYLKNKQPIIVVDNWQDRSKIMAGDNWRRELYFGMQNTPLAHQWLIQPDALKQVLGKYSAYVFSRSSDKDYLMQHYHLKLIASTPKVALLTNIKTRH